MRWILTLIFVLVATPVQAQVTKTEKVVYTAMVLADIADVESTFCVIRHGGREGNPAEKWFIGSGRKAAYAKHLALDALIIYISHKKHSVTVPTVMIGAHSFAVTWNLTKGR